MFRGPYDPGDDRTACEACDGEGETLSRDAEGAIIGIPCSSCRGRGWVREDQRERERALEREALR